MIFGDIQLHMQAAMACLYSGLYEVFVGGRNDVSLCSFIKNLYLGLKKREERSDIFLG